MSDKRKVVGVTILVIVLIAIFAGTLVMLNVRKRNIQAQSVLGEMDMSVFPYVVSLPPVTGIEGEEYVYDVRYSDRDSESSDIVITLVDAPTWLNVSEMKISGIPPFGSAGQYKLSVRISDGRNSTMQENYILINGNVK